MGFPTDDRFKTPGQLITHLLSERAWDQSVLALVLGVDRTVITKLVSGARAVDGKTALILGEVFGVDPERFLTLQKTYELQKARIETIPDEGRANRAALFSALPIGEMIRRGWLLAESVRDLHNVESSLARFFCADSVDKIEVLPHAARKTATTSPATPAQIAWIYRVRQIAKSMVVSNYSASKAHKLVPSLGDLLSAAEEVRKVPRLMGEAGIRFVIVECLKDSKIDGVALWLDDTSPVIGMSLRFDRIDNFWFVLRHELEHILRRHGGSAITLDADLQGLRAGTTDAVPEEERVANGAAADFCVPSVDLEQFFSRKAPIFPERDVLGFARTIDVHPGLVAGQLQRRTGRFDLLRRHLVKIRSLICPSAMVDGWGDIAYVPTV
jgi:HTH-type transcriptional regulator/antitoxin HigA